MTDEREEAGQSGGGRESLWKRIWKQPRWWFLFGIPFGGFAMFVVGILFWGGLHTAIEATDSIAFCTSCHEMSWNYDEYKQSTHFQNPMGVRAICTDCHVPKQWGPMILRKIQATHDIWGHLTRAINTKKKFEAKREEMAEYVWNQMKATDSRECRNCHSYEAMAISEQGHSAAKKHTRAWHKDTGQTCIDCHKGLVHDLPKVGF